MKKGFTLIEVIAVIAIISVLMVLAIPNILNNVSNKRNEVSDTAKEMIYSAADMYVKENAINYPIEENAKYCIKLETLVNNGKLVAPVKDLKNGKEIPLNNYVKVDINNYEQYEYSLVKNCE